MKFDSKLYRYKVWRRSVVARGIEPRLTFEEWFGLWQPYWERKLQHPRELVLARCSDQGHYEIGNVYITTNGQNAADAVVFKALANWPAEDAI